jgi:peptidoglycan hydrolase-like protein with peptidoglycan-binding domain
MVNKVKLFQSYAGLNPDGFVGTTTVFHLIMKTGSVGLTLDDKKGIN